MAATILLLTGDSRLCEVVEEAAFAADQEALLEHFEGGTGAVQRLCDTSALKPLMVIVDLTTTPDGIRFIEFVKSSGSTRSLPMMAITEAQDTPAAVFSRFLGVTPILVKPVAPKEIVDIIGTVRDTKFGNRALP